MNKEYLELWDEFYTLLEKNGFKNDKGYRFKAFCELYSEKEGNENPEYEVDTFLTRLTKQRKRSKKTTTPQENTVREIEAFINFLGKERAPFRLLPDEEISDWFD